MPHTIDRAELIRKANLNYQGTAARSEEGLPIGNGTMGTMIWTSPASIKTQINRVDVFANGNQTNSFIDTHEDYGYACAYMDIDFAGFGPDVFDGSTEQTLDVYDAAASIKSNGISAECFAAEGSDVIAYKIEDSRTTPQGIEIRLRMMRNAYVRTRSHVAKSTLIRIGEIAVLKQEFIEDDFYCASAVAVRAIGRASRIRVDDENNGTFPVLPPSTEHIHGQEGETQIRIMLPPEQGAFEVYASSAATLDSKQDVVRAALFQLSKAEAKRYDALKAEHDAWWHHFWQGSFVSLSGNPSAEMVSVHYTYFLYIMASCSRNDQYAPNFGGLLFSPRGDRRHWGTMQWWNNLSLMYNAILPTGHVELIKPYLNMFFNMYGASEAAARQIWGAEGIFIGETTYVWGPEVLPEAIAQELRDLMLLRKPWSERSEAFNQFASGKNPFETRWNFLVGQSTDPNWRHGQLLYEETPFGAVAHVSHIFGSMANLAYHYWLTYEYTGNESFLRKQAYPMLRGITEFFRTYPNLIKEDDGLYHLLYSNHGESYWGAKDTLDTMTGMHGIFPTTIHTAELLGVDADKIPLWQEILDNLAPMPTSEDTECDVEIPDDGSVVWVGARGHAILNYREGRRVRPNPCTSFDLCNLQTEEVNPTYYSIGRNMIDRIKRGVGVDDLRWYASEMSGYPRIFAVMGEGDLLLDNIIRQLNSECAAQEHCFYDWNGSQAVYRNRLTAREGINAISAQRLGNAAAGLQLGLMQCSGGAPTLPPVIRVFPAWKRDWDASFELHARGGFIVSSEMKDGKILFVTINAQRDGRLTLINPWGEDTAVSDGSEQLSGKKIIRDMKAGESITFTEAGSL
ncbi:hypothetical protein FACS1894184_10660 [Clostridia bacterium]|nr:hypothetical protein FACS1894184_10660 [Clostridia bacterium]